MKKIIMNLSENRFHIQNALFFLLLTLNFSFWQFIYLLHNPVGTMKLYQFISIFGVLILLLAQIPSVHSLRHINLVSLTLCLAFSACVTAGSIHVGKTKTQHHVTENMSLYMNITDIEPYTAFTGYSKNAPTRDHSLNSSGVNRVFGGVNAVSIIATTYACGIIPEIQV